MAKTPNMPSPCCGVESSAKGLNGWRCGQCGRTWWPTEADRLADERVPRHLQYLTQAEIDDSPNREFAGLTVEGWYFWDETEAGAHGPYPTQQVASEKLAEYGRQV